MIHSASCRPSGLALALSLAGCATMIPNYERPGTGCRGLPGRPRRRCPPARPRATSSAKLLRRRALKRLIDVALQNNRDLRVAVLNIEQARAQYRYGAPMNCHGRVGATGSRQPSGSGGISSVYTAGFSVTATSSTSSARAQPEPGCAGPVSGHGRGAQERADRADFLGGDTHLNLLADEQLLAVTQRTLATREESLKLTKLKFDAGAASELDYRQPNRCSKARAPPWPS